jgi:hypothetical protein
MQQPWLTRHSTGMMKLDRKTNGRKMVKGTCLAALQRKTGTPRRPGPGSPRRMAPTQCYLT